MDWNNDIKRWPNHERSELIRCEPHVWHVQNNGNGPKLLFLHGTGASLHSWAPLINSLGKEIQSIVIDLPGHGFTELGTTQRSSLTLMVKDIIRLIRHIDYKPDIIVGHSAGVAIALEISREIVIKGVFGVNPALSKFSGVAGFAFPMIAKVMAINPLTSIYLAGLGKSRTRVDRLLKATGSVLNESQIALYHKLFQDKKHIQGTLLMMAQWNLDRLLFRLSQIPVPSLFVTGQLDKTVSPRTLELQKKKDTR